jgi:hypothetical protein
MNLVIFRSSFTQSINFNFSNNTNSSYLLQDIRKITFDFDLMNIVFYDGNVYSWNVSTINSFDYNESSNDVTEILVDGNSFNLQIYPNPSEEFLNISYILKAIDPITIVFTDLNGKVLKEDFIVNPMIGNNKHSINISSFPNGVFNCLLTNGKISVTKKIIKK